MSTVLLVFSTAIVVAQEKTPDPAMEALQKVQDIVGHWKGSGSGDHSKGWDESLECVWKFKKDGKCGLYLKLVDSKKKTAGRLFDEAAITFNADKNVYVLKANKAGDDTEAALVQFEGKFASDSNLVFDRIEKGDAKDAFDRIDFKVINGGDRVVYTVQRRVGQSRHYRKFAQVALDRDGTSLAGAAANKPKCIITGGAGTMTVSYKDQSYPVCCSGCREMFLENPEKYLAKLEKKNP